MQERKWKISSWKNVKQRYLIESNMSATAPLPSPPIQRWHLDRRDNPPIIIESPKKKRGGGKKSSALYDISGKKMMVSKRRSSRLEKKSIGRVRGSAAKMAAPHQAIPRRGWWHTHRWPRFCRFCRSFFFFFFPPFSLSPATLLDRLSLARQEVPLFSRSWQIRLMRWTRWDMGQRIGVQCRHGRGVTVPWKRPCPGPQSRRELSAGWSPV